MEESPESCTESDKILPSESPTLAESSKPSLAQETRTDVLPTQEITPSSNLPQVADKMSSQLLSKVDAVMKELTASYSALEEQAKASISLVRQLLDQKEAELLATYKTSYDIKLDSLSRYRERLLSSHEELPFPSLTGGTLCGFVPEMMNVMNSMACLMLEHREEVSVGEEMSVSVIGSMNMKGCFWLRILPDAAGLQDIMLQNISSTIGMELSLSSRLPILRSPRVGDVCCAQYSEDKRWYRTRVVELLKNGHTAKVYFLDYGNIEKIPYSGLCELDPKFLVYPFQMIQCCFSTDPDLKYEREVKWKFTDLTHGNDLTANILEYFPDKINGRLHLVKLTNCSTAEPFDVGINITMMAGKVTSQPSTIKYRDIRILKKNQDENQTVASSSVQPQPPLPPHPETIPTVTTDTSKNDNTESAPTSETDRPDVHLLESNATISPSPLPNQNLSQEEMNSTIRAPASSTTTSSTSSTMPSTSSAMPSTSSAMPITTNTRSSHKLKDSNTPCIEHSEQFVQEASAQVEAKQEMECVTGEPKGGATGEPKGSVEIGRERSPIEGDVADVGAKVEPVVGNSDIPSAAQIKVLGPTSGMDARSSSHNPIPVPNEVIAVNAASDKVVTSMENDIVKKGAEIHVYVTMPLSASGTFWVQLASSEEPEFLEMVEKLQQHCQNEPPTPVFFSPGDLCAAQFSEDGCWYRGRVETIIDDQFLVRYLDYGNCEKRKKECVISLHSKFRMIPFQALCCSIACPGHVAFTEKEIECFRKLTDSQKLVAKILENGEKSVNVQLILSLPSGSVDLNEEVYAADVKIGETMSFSLKTSSPQDKSPPEPPLPLAATKEVAAGTNWADYMDDLQSPHNDDGIFTLPGQEGGTFSHTPTPTPTPRLSPSPQPPQVHRSTPPPPSYSSKLQTPYHNSENTHRERGGTTKSVSPRSGTPTSVKTSSSVGRSSSVPRIHSEALGLVRKSLLSGEKSWDRRDRTRSNQSRPPQEHNANSETALSSSPSSLPSSNLTAPPGLPQPKGVRSLNQVSRNGTSFPPTGRRRKSPEPDQSQVKLFVRYMPHNKTLEDVYHLFNLYGHIYMLEYHTDHKDKLYLIMDREGGMKAVQGLNGNHLSGSPKPLSVQPYKVASIRASEQQELDSLPVMMCTRLFVKNIPLDRTMQDMKGLFAQYGKVIGLVPVPDRKNVIYMYMDPRGAESAIDGLHGKAISKHSKPLIVEVSSPPRKARS